MKIRIRGDSLRLRLSQSDVRALDREGSVGDELHFPAGTALGCELRVTDGTDALDAALGDHTILITIPRAWARKLIDTDEVGVRSEVALEGGRTLVLLVEKDFRCLVPRDGEEDSDGFDRSGC
jgi:hypothetical protein